MMSSQESIKIQIDDQVIELTGAEKEAFLADVKATQEARDLIATEKQLKQESAQAKFAALGLTADDLKSLGL
jgi:hypothetical protein